MLEIPIRKMTNEQRRQYRRELYQRNKSNKKLVACKQLFKQSDGVPDTAPGMESVKDDVATMQQNCLRQNKFREKMAQKRKEMQMDEYYSNLPTIPTQDEKDELIKLFETHTNDIQNRLCQLCKMVSVNLEVSKDNICITCKRNNETEERLIEKGCLPVWFDDASEPHYSLPEELRELTPGEQSLIQLVSPIMPLTHLKNGTFGMKGHVCAFPQDISSVAKELPRLPSDVNVVHVLRKVTMEVGSDHVATKMYKVRKQKVITALKWLKKYHRDYRDDETITI